MSRPLKQEKNVVSEYRHVGTLDLCSDLAKTMEKRIFQSGLPSQIKRPKSA